MDCKKGRGGWKGGRVGERARECWVNVNAVFKLLRTANLLYACFDILLMEMDMH